MYLSPHSRVIDIIKILKLSTPSWYSIAINDPRGAPPIFLELAAGACKLLLAD